MIQILPPASAVHSIARLKYERISGQDVGNGACDWLQVMPLSRPICFSLRANARYFPRQADVLWGGLRRVSNRNRTWQTWKNPRRQTRLLRRIPRLFSSPTRTDAVSICVDVLMKAPPFYRHYRAEKGACQASLSAFGLWKSRKHCTNRHKNDRPI